MDTTPTNTPWFTKEVDLLEKILAARIKSEEDDLNIPSLDRVQTYHWLSEQLRSQGGYNRSPLAIERRLQGRLKFPRSPPAKPKTPVLPQAQSFSVSESSSMGRANTPSNTKTKHIRPSCSASSSSDEIPLGQLRGSNRTVSATSSIVSWRLHPSSILPFKMPISQKV